MSTTSRLYNKKILLPTIDQAFEILRYHESISHSEVEANSVRISVRNALAAAALFSRVRALQWRRKPLLSRSKTYISRLEEWAREVAAQGVLRVSFVKATIAILREEVSAYHNKNGVGVYENFLKLKTQSSSPEQASGE